MNFKNIGLAIVATALLASCAKDATTNPTQNSAALNNTVLLLNNRITANFALDSNAIPGVASSVYPVGSNGFTNFNRFRRIGTFDTTASANRPPVVTVGSTINIVTFIKGDDSAMAKRSLNFRFFRPPSNSPSWITPTASLGNVMFAAENAYRGFNPASGDILAGGTQSLAGPIVPVTTTSAPLFTVTKVANEVNEGINISTYLVALRYTIPSSFAGQLISINFNVGPSIYITSGSNAESLGVCNWNYAFRVP
jgi:hypothetical protein